MPTCLYAHRLVLLSSDTLRCTARHDTRPQDDRASVSSMSSLPNKMTWCTYMHMCMHMCVAICNRMHIDMCIDMCMTMCIQVVDDFMDTQPWPSIEEHLACAGSVCVRACMRVHLPSPNQLVAGHRQHVFHGNIPIRTNRHYAPCCRWKPHRPRKHRSLHASMGPAG